MTAQPIPEAAQAHITRLTIQAESIQAQMQSFMDGVLLGLGVDVVSNDVNVNLEKMTYEVTKKADSVELEKLLKDAEIVEDKPVKKHNHLE